jgi:hypothetical protein
MRLLQQGVGKMLFIDCDDWEQAQSAHLKLNRSQITRLLRASASETLDG